MSEFEYVLALELGTSRIAAATARLAPSGEITDSACPLGRQDRGVEALAALSDDGSLVFGAAAEDTAARAPERALRGFTAHVGDEIPLVAGDRAITAADLTAEFVDWARDIVATREDHAPASLVIAHPASWTAHRTEALRAALSRREITDVEFVSAAEAVTIVHDEQQTLASGEAIAVFDLGGTAFEATVVRKTAGGPFRSIGATVALGDQGGSSFDDAVLAHALTVAQAEGHLSTPGSDADRALARLRRSCIAAKHALSIDGEATISVPLDDGESGEATVRITRSEFEAMIEPSLDAALGALERAITDSGRSTDRVSAILLTGGSSRIPLIAQLLSERFDRPLAVVVDDAGARGAARRGILDLAARAPRDTIAYVAPHGAGVAATAPRRHRPLRMPRRTAVALSVVAAAMVVTAGAAATAFAAGLSPTSADKVTADGSRTATGPAGFGLAALLTVPLGDGGSAGSMEPVVVPVEVDPPAAEQDDDVPAARRAARSPIADSGRSTPPAQSTTDPVRTTPSGTTPLAPVTTPRPVTPPPVVQPSVDQPPAEQPPAEEPPAEEPPAEQPPVEQPAPPAPDPDPAAPSPEL
ncbi:Hsp70 family protein [Microbacterium maritypicum]